MNMNEYESQIAELAETSPIVSRKDLIGKFPRKIVKDLTSDLNRVGRGQYDLRIVLNTIARNNAASPAETVQTEVTDEKAPAPTFTYCENIGVPMRDKHFVGWGFFDRLKQIFASNDFFPVFIHSMSGTGKTVMVRNAAAEANRKLIRIQFTPETDADELIGGWRLVNGDTVFVEGPVIRAMKSGAILLCDEIDRAGNNAVLAMQSIVEGAEAFLPKTGEVVRPAPGFTIVATANTQGRGSTDGLYTGAQILDDAFLERFVISYEQPFPTKSVETKILKQHAKRHNIDDAGDFIAMLIGWAQAIRKTFEDGGIETIISTRRLEHVLHTFGVFRKRMESIEFCVNRFDSETRDAFVNLYKQIDPNWNDGNESEIPSLSEEELEHRIDAATI